MREAVERFACWALLLGLAAWPAAAGPADTDGDGVADTVDNCPIRFNPDQLDGDVDGTGDPCDNCPTFPNPDQTESEPVGSFGPALLISSGEPAAADVVPADLDGDGDLDVLFASYYRVSWAANTDGAGTFGPAQVVSTEIEWSWSVDAADLDGDGDLDVLSGSYGDGKVAWYENLDGAGEFGPQQLIADGPANHGVHAADLDGDGDFDVAAGGEGHAEWFENLDGRGGFGPARILSRSLNTVWRITDADLDGDAERGIVVAAFPSVWFENRNGMGSFSPAHALAGGGQGIDAADIDGDGDDDLVHSPCPPRPGCTYVAGIGWSENLDGRGTFGETTTIFDSGLPVTSVAGVDIDGDGDRDVLSASYYDDTVLWHENLDGEGTFGPGHTIAIMSRGPESVAAADFDADGDLDAVSAVYSDSRIEWHENGGDGVGDPCDCRPDSAQVWGAPAAVADLTIGFTEDTCLIDYTCSLSGAVCWSDADCNPSLEDLLWSWSSPPALGATSIRFDFLRAEQAPEFDQASCLESDETNVRASNDADPPPGSVRFYLVRVENDSPASNAGQASSGAPRTAAACP